jgi:hypothetical protein
MASRANLADAVATIFSLIGMNFDMILDINKLAPLLF